MASLYVQGVYKSGQFVFDNYSEIPYSHVCDLLSHSDDHVLQVTKSGLSSTNTGLHESNQCWSLANDDNG